MQVRTLLEWEKGKLVGMPIVFEDLHVSSTMVLAEAHDRVSANVDCFILDGYEIHRSLACLEGLR